MKLLWAGLIFGAGYALGRPEGRAKLAELSKRPEVTQPRQKAASTVASGAKTGQQQLAHAAHTVKDKASEKLPGKTASGADAVTEPSGARRGLRLPSFPRRSGRPDTSTMPAAGRSRRRPEPRQPARPPARRRSDVRSHSPWPRTAGCCACRCP
jgi:hypothetical protein